MAHYFDAWLKETQEENEFTKVRSGISVSTLTSLMVKAWKYLLEYNNARQDPAVAGYLHAASVMLLYTSSITEEEFAAMSTMSIAEWVENGRQYGLRELWKTKGLGGGTKSAGSNGSSEGGSVSSVKCDAAAVLKVAQKTRSSNKDPDDDFVAPDEGEEENEPAPKTPQKNNKGSDPPSLKPSKGETTPMSKGNALTITDALTSARNSEDEYVKGVYKHRVSFKDVGSFLEEAFSIPGLEITALAVRALRMNVTTIRMPAEPEFVAGEPPEIREMLINMLKVDRTAIANELTALLKLVFAADVGDQIEAFRKNFHDHGHIYRYVVGEKKKEEETLENQGKMVKKTSDWAWFQGYLKKRYQDLERFDTKFNLCISASMIRAITGDGLLVYLGPQPKHRTWWVSPLQNVRMTTH